MLYVSKDSLLQYFIEHKTGFYLVCDIREAFPHAVSHYNRHLLMIDDSHLLLIDDVAGAEGRRLWVNGQTYEFLEENGELRYLFKASDIIPPGKQPPR